MVKRALEGRGLRDAVAPGRPAVPAVAVPMQTGAELVGVLVAGYGLNEAVASQIRKLTHSGDRLPRPGSRARGAARRVVAGPARGRPGRRRLEAGDRPGGRGALRARPRRGPPHRRARPPEDGDRRGDRRRPRPAQPLRGDRLLPPVPRQPRPRLPRGAPPSGFSPRGAPPPGSPARCASWCRSSSASATAPTPGRSRSRAATRSVFSPARSTGSSPTCARRTR